MTPPTKQGKAPYAPYTGHIKHNILQFQPPNHPNNFVPCSFFVRFYSVGNGTNLERTWNEHVSNMSRRGNNPFLSGCFVPFRGMRLSGKLRWKV